MNDTRTYLYVPPEKYDQVEALGAHREAGPPVRWYIDMSQDRAVFKPWLYRGPVTGPYSIESSEAFVAETTSECWHCHGITPVIGLHCENGLVNGQPLDDFMV